ncbi:MAG TPA: hypothetical protein VGH44_01375 [Candidatus Saccharimonadia bacterium]|jgi:hypothetical protein
MDTPEPTTPHSTPRDVVILRSILGLVLAVIAALGLWTGYAYLISPAPIRQPQTDHVHLRLQIINDGHPVDFADSKFQTTFNQDICSAALTKEPFHFHDNLDQFVHVHWANLTGGLLLKNYGWNFIGGPDTTLGYRFDKFPHLVRVPIHGLNLPTPARDDNFYVYTGNQNGYQERNWHDFLTQDIPGFMAGQPVTRTNLIPTALADTTQSQAAELNHVLGSVVIFAQKTKPTDQQVKDRFNHLIPIPTSQCSG